ncbi:hypothetical protein BMR07_07195 [Methylococcaceae bacterium CS1]|nr:hypothetical protein BMR07_07195 [Methylococcaceae bacterium CS1]
MKLIKANTEYLNAYENITSIKGLGQKSGIVLLYLFLRYPNVVTQASDLDDFIQKVDGYEY